MGLGPHSHAEHLPPPPAMSDHTLASIRQEIYLAEQRVHDLDVELTSAREYLSALHRRHGELLLQQ